MGVPRVWADLTLWSAVEEVARSYSHVKADFSKLNSELEPEITNMQIYLKRLHKNAAKLEEMNAHYQISTVEDAATSLDAVEKMLENVIVAIDVANRRAESLQQRLNSCQSKVDKSLQDLVRLLPIEEYTSNLTMEEQPVMIGNEHQILSSE